jgi:hypothetical protein
VDPDSVGAAAVVRAALDQGAANLADQAERMRRLADRGALVQASVVLTALFAGAIEPLVVLRITTRRG